MRYYSLVLVTSVLCACTTAPKEYYKPHGADRVWEISGKLIDHTGNLIISIDGETVIDGIVDFTKAESPLTGEYNGHSVSTTCVSVENYLMPFVNMDRSVKRMPHALFDNWQVPCNSYMHSIWYMPI